MTEELKRNEKAKVIFTAGKNSIGQYQAEIGDGGTGYRIAGGKYDGGGTMFLKAELNERACKEIRCYLDAAFPRAPDPAFEAMREALNVRDLFINPDTMEEYADEIDCCYWGACPNIYKGSCIASESGAYCPNDLAATLRAVAKAARAALAQEAEKA